MKINTIALKNLAKNKDWSIPELAKQLEVDYSYLYRVLNNEKNGGTKLFSGIFQLCKKEGLNIDDYIFLNKPLSTDNCIKNKTTA